LETLDVAGIRTEDLFILRQCPQLITLTAQGDIITLKRIIDAAPPCLVDCRLHIDRWVRALDPRSYRLLFLSCMRRGTAVSSMRRDLDNASFQGLVLEEISSLVQLDLEGTAVDDVRSLAGCRALKELKLANSPVTDVGISGLERIATLEVLNLAHCKRITSVTSLRHCTALRELVLNVTSVTNAGIAGLECIVTLTKLSLGVCRFITSVSSLRHCPSLRQLDISNAELTAAGTTGLDEIGTLERLKACGRTHLDASTLRRCRSLREVDLSASDATDAVLDSLADVSTLEILKLTYCHRRYCCREVRDVSVLARSVSLRRLDLDVSAVSDAGIAGLERIPSLTLLSLIACRSITNVTNLFRSKSLRWLVLVKSSVTDAGLVGLELAPALEFVDLRGCAGIVDVASIVLRAAERSVKVSV
jgi:Leucine-rich repeat (LRR) protein